MPKQRYLVPRIVLRNMLKRKQIMIEKSYLQRRLYCKLSRSRTGPEGTENPDILCTIGVLHNLAVIAK
jgi:hypothetical protein